MTSISETQKTKHRENKSSFTGSTALFGLFSLFFVITSFLFSFLIFYHATLNLESQVIHDKADLYKAAMLSRLPLTSEMSSETIVTIQNFISDLKSQDTQLTTVAVFTKDGTITYSSTLGLIGDRIMDHWQDFLAQNPVIPEILGDRDLSLFYPIPKTDGLYLSLTFKKDSFLTLISKNQGLLIVTGLSTLVLGLYLLTRHIPQLKGFDFRQDPLLQTFEKRKKVVQTELNDLSKDLKNYENL